MTEAIRAGCILTMDPACPEFFDGGVLIRDGRILAVGPWHEVAGHGVPRDLGAVTIVPGLINAHTHLELSHLAGHVTTGHGFMVWADSLFAAMRRERASESAAGRAVEEARLSGTCFVGDVVGREIDMVCRALDNAGVEGIVFREFSGREREFKPSPLAASWSPALHSLYAADPGFAQTVKAWCSRRDLPFSLHLAEVPGENELFRSGDGEFADFLRARRILSKGFKASGFGAVELADKLGLLDRRTLAVHCVHLSDGDVEILARSGASVCLCLRSNRLIGVGEAPVAAMHAAGIGLCLGTDSLASVENLDLWEEVRAMRALLQSASLQDLLSTVTVNPARILGIEQDFGSLEAGKRAVWAVLPGDFCRL